jgi:Trk K+ transport system NAD-binding subunit
MREVAQEPWDISVRLSGEPSGVRRYLVHHGSAAAGTRLEDLAISEDTWISMILHEGNVVQPDGAYVIEPGDELLVLTEVERFPELQRLFDPR